MPITNKPILKKVTFLFGALLLFVVFSFIAITQSARWDTGDTDHQKPITREDPQSTQYLTFQIFTEAENSPMFDQSIPQVTKTIASSVSEIISTIGETGGKKQKLGFVVGPLAFDHTDEQIQQLIRESFTTALENDVAVGFHIDDAMFWERLLNLNTTENIEWLDWDKTPNTGRRLDWSATPLKIMPQLCFNSPSVEAEVIKRANLIGEEVKLGLRSLMTAGKPELFAGVIAGWETQIGRDFATDKYLGYCALSNLGYSATNPPQDIDTARTEIVKDFINLWSTALFGAGVPKEKIFSHTAFLSQALYDSAQASGANKLPGNYLETINFTPPQVAFGANHYAGFSTYPQLGLLKQIQAERGRNNNQPWASTEGTALQPDQADKGSRDYQMETYLGNLLNHGAVLVNIFGWGIGEENNSFRKVAEHERAIAAYRKFLRGEILEESHLEQIPSSQFYAKVEKLQKQLPEYFSKNGTGGDVGTLYNDLGEQLDAKLYTDAEKTIDAIFKFIGSD